MKKRTNRMDADGGCMDEKDTVDPPAKNYHLFKKEQEDEIDAQPIFSAFEPLWVIRADINVVWIIFFFLSCLTRMCSLETPRYVVFDEVHFGQYIGYYLNNTFFFDVHPPLGKLILATTAWLAGSNGKLTSDPPQVGQEYLPYTPLWHLRLVPAFFGSLLPPLAYCLVVELNFSHYAATLAAFLLVFENSLVTQSRFILLDSMLLFFIILSLFSLIKLRKLKVRYFSIQWWTWVLMVSLSLTATISIKYSGLFTVILVGLIIAYDLWNLIEDRALSPGALLWRYLLHILVLIILPIFLYIGQFFVQFLILTHSGPHDSLMSSLFQASLQGGLSNVMQRQPVNVVFGSQVTLRHAHGQICWLHSHQLIYPVRYSDGRGSSAQQQVTCYTYKDVNNWWIVKHPERPSLLVDDLPKSVRHGDVIQLIHGATGRALNSHDIGAPVSPQFMEVSCYIDYNISYPALNLWRVEIVNHQSEGEVWKAVASYVRLIHISTGQALKLSGSQLADWGFYQFEVVTDRVKEQESTLWNVEEHRYTKFDNNGQYSNYEADSSNDIRDTMSLWGKFLEMQWKMIDANSELKQEHKYSSEPLEWPLMQRGIAYWLDLHSNAQIHCHGNVVTWWSATGALVLYALLAAFYTCRRRRLSFDLDEDTWNAFAQAGFTLLGGWLFNYLPFFFMERTLFLHHYLPALVYKILLLALTVEHIYVCLSKRYKSLGIVYLSLIAVWCTSIVVNFFKFSAITYGHKALSSDEIEQLQWMESWEFLQHNKYISFLKP